MDLTPIAVNQSPGMKESSGFFFFFLEFDLPLRVHPLTAMCSAAVASGSAGSLHFPQLPDNSVQLNILSGEGPKLLGLV